MRKSTRRSVLGGLVATGAALSLFPAASARDQDRCVLRFAWTDWAPLQYRDKAGERRGLDHDLIVAVVRRMGCEVEWIDGPRSRGYALLQEGGVDAMAGMTYTRQRETFGIFSEPFRMGHNVLVIRRGEAGSWPFVDLAALAASGFRLGVLQGARYSQHYEGLLRDGLLADNLVIGPSNEALMTMLVRERIDGYIDGHLAAAHLARTLGLTQAVEEHPMQVSLTTAHVLFSRKTVEPGLVRRFNEALAAIRADGTYDLIQNAVRTQ